jgi:ABC-2 type transport system ATP-binding protein
MLVIDGLTKTFAASNRLALDRVSLAVPQGSFTALLGQNGAGKSTLIGILAGTVLPDAGTADINGHSLATRSAELKRSLGIVAQEIAFDPFFTVEETLSLQSGFFGIRKNGDWIRLLLERLSLWDRRNDPVRDLSGGMKRRLMIAKALVHRPRLLLLDEPTAGVDVQLRKQMHEFLNEMNREGMTIILTTHYLEEAEQLCDHVVLLHEGKILVDVPRPEFMQLAGKHLLAQLQAQRPELLQAAFRTHGLESSKSADGILKLAVPASQRTQFLGLLGEHAADIKDIQITEPRLEDVFMQLTRATSHEGRNDEKRPAAAA